MLEGADQGWGGGGTIAFAPAKWPLQGGWGAPALPSRDAVRGPRSGLAGGRWRRPALSLLVLGGSVFALVSAYAETGLQQPVAAPAAAIGSEAPAALPAEAPEGEADGTTFLVGLRAGERIDRAMARAGVAADEARAVRRALLSAIFAHEPAPGAQLRLRLGERTSFFGSRPLKSARFETRGGASVTVTRDGARFRAAAAGLTAAELPRRIDGAVGDDPFRSLRAAGLSTEAANAFLRAVATRLPLRSLAPDDHFLAIVEPSGELLLARIARQDGSRIALVKWTSDDGQEQWLDSDGRASEAGGVLRPVAGPITSSFGMRLHPILGFRRIHRGVDFGAPSGTPIVAAMDGRVSASGWQGGYGRQVRLDHGGSVVTTYSHMSAIAVAPGTLVRQGQVLGYVGSSGLSTGPHLHYEAFRGGIAVNPLSIGRPIPPRLTGQERDQFEQRMRALLAIAPGASPHLAAAVSAPAAETRLRL